MSPVDAMQSQLPPGTLRLLSTLRLLATLRVCAFFLVALSLGACGNFAADTASADANGCDAPDNATGVRLELVNQQMTSGHYHAALAQLQAARQLAPIDADIRNDYGFVLLAAGRIKDALRELHTAVELDAGNVIAARNLMLTLFVAQRDDEARALGQGRAFVDSDIEMLATRARNYKPLATSTLQEVSVNETQ